MKEDFGIVVALMIWVSCVAYGITHGLYRGTEEKAPTTVEAVTR